MDLAELLIRESVRDTIAGYNAAGDRGDLDGLAACFAADGILAIKGRDPLIGPAAIRDGLTPMLDGRQAPDGPRSSRYLHHHVSSLHITIAAPHEVTTTCYFAVLTRVGLDHWGRYTDRLVPVGDRWLFARRDIATDGYAPDSLFGR